MLVHQPEAPRADINAASHLHRLIACCVCHDWCLHAPQGVLQGGCRLRRQGPEQASIMSVMHAGEHAAGHPTFCAFRNWWSMRSPPCPTGSWQSDMPACLCAGAMATSCSRALEANASTSCATSPPWTTTAPGGVDSKPAGCTRSSQKPE
jgi:hypothetical protein